MTQLTLKIATRQSPLALWQANYVKARVQAQHADLNVELVPFVTKGDVLLDSPLAKIGGKGLFVKELELALLNGEADIAVHSMKDVPMEFPEGLDLIAICAREDARDAFVSNRYKSLDELPQGAVVGTSSLRRQCQLKHLRPDLEVRPLRGNVGTRLSKLDNGEFDAIILAAAGLIRLDLAHRITAFISTDLLLPAVGQGAVGIECRADDVSTQAAIVSLADRDTTYCVLAERAMNIHLQGGCQVPIAGYAEIQHGKLQLRALVGSPDGTQIIRAQGEIDVSDVESAVKNAEVLGIQVAEQLLQQGAEQILQAIQPE